MKIYCDNLSTIFIFIASNLLFHERTKHTEVDCHFVIEAVMSKQIYTPYIKLEE